jgi:hypothetical protein
VLGGAERWLVRVRRYGFKSIGIQMHYTNDAGASGLVDDSAVRLYISHTPRTHTVGVLQLGGWGHDATGTFGVGTHVCEGCMQREELRVTTQSHHDDLPPSCVPLPSNTRGGGAQATRW